MIHTPVLVQEILDIFDPEDNQSLLDATIGLGGHAKAYLDAASNTSVVGVDSDQDALQEAATNLTAYGKRVELVNASYVDLAELAQGRTFNHILFDLGIGTHQLSDPNRGFSFTSTTSLSMRYGSEAVSGNRLPPSDFASLQWLEKHLGHAPDAQEIVDQLPAEELESLIRQLGQERLAGRIAKAIKKHLPISTSKELADIIVSVTPGNYEHGRLHPATRTFQALRIAVNRELESLAIGLNQAFTVLAPKGKLAVISFHSLEDRIVKKHLKENEELEVLTKKPIQASAEEIKDNPRSRSAKLRAAQTS